MVACVQPQFFHFTNTFVEQQKYHLQKQTTFFNQTCINTGILTVAQLLDKNGHLLSCEDFLYHFKFPVKPKDYAIVFDDVFKGILVFLSNFGGLGLGIQ